MLRLSNWSQYLFIIMEAKSSLIESFGLMFKINQFIGACPFYALVDETTHYEIVTPMSLKTYLGLTTLATLFCATLLSIGLFISSTQCGLSLLLVFKILIFEINDTNTDALIWGISWINVFSGMLLIQMKTYRLTRYLPEWHLDYANCVSRLTLKKPKIDAKIKSRYYLTVFCFSLAFTKIAIGLHLFLCEFSKTQYIVHFPLFIAILIEALYLVSHVHNYGSLYGECAGNLAIWANLLAERMNKRQIQSVLSEDLNECLKLHKSLLGASKTFSPQLGIGLNLNVINLIFIFYRVLAFFIGDYEHTLSMILIQLGFGSVGLELIAFALYFNMTSQHVIDEVKKLINVLEQLPIQVCHQACLENNHHPGLYAREYVTKKLESFNGFAAGNFVKLNRDLLSGIAAIFVTYVIVLIQFKLSEKP